MDATIVNVAIPRIRADLAATPTQMQWVIDVYTLVVFAVFGIGFSMVNAPIANEAVSGMPVDRAGAALADPTIDFARTARPLWLLFAGVGLLIFALGYYSTSPRGLRSAERLAPLIAGPQGGSESAR